MDKQSSTTNNGEIFKGELPKDQAVTGSKKSEPDPKGPAVTIGSTKDVDAHEHRTTNTPIHKEEKP